MMKTRCKSSSLVAAGLALIGIGCQSTGRSQSPLLFHQTPPAVQSAFLAFYSTDATIQQIYREQMGGQDYYDFTFTDKAGKKHEVELNEGGDQIDQH